ncbi:MAG: FISUMP domain-containing protein [Candidatus Falkowbacteria bacterium]
MFHKFKKAFTLIELLVVIAIIGLLATIAIVALNNARSKARDARRVADVKQIQTALDLYYNDAGHYPLNNIFASGTIFTTSTVTGTTTYMQIVPHAPTPTDGSCNVAANTYSYAVDSEGKAYNIGYCLGGPAGSMAAGYKCATPDGVFNIACAGAATSTNMVGGGGAANFTSCGDQVSYGGKNYDTVQIGTQCWFVQNLNIGTEILGANNQSDVSTSSTPTDFQKYCFGDMPTSCNTNGGLYQYHTAMAWPATCDNHNGFSPCDLTYPHQGMCPTNWHIPSDDEWHALELFYSNPSNETACSALSVGDHCPGAGTALTQIGAGNFNAIFGGFRNTDGSFIYGGSNQYNGAGEFHWWSATPPTNSTAWERSNNYPGYIWRTYASRTRGYSIRCIHD